MLALSPALISLHLRGASEQGGSADEEFQEFSSLWGKLMRRQNDEKASMPAGAGIGGHRYLVHESEITPIGQNYLENSQWFNIDLSLSEQGEE